jgi:hypothetical protein
VRIASRQIVHGTTRIVRCSWLLDPSDAQCELHLSETNVPNCDKATAGQAWKLTRVSCRVPSMQHCTSRRFVPEK